MTSRSTTHAILIVATAAAGVATALLWPGAGRGFGFALIVVAGAVLASTLVRRFRRGRWRRVSDAEFAASPLFLPAVSPDRAQLVRTELARILDQPVETISPDATVSDLISRDAWFGSESMGLDDLRDYVLSLGGSVDDGQMRVADIVNLTVQPTR